MSRKGRPDWAAIARDYARDVLTMAEICERHGITPWSLRHRIRKEGWRTRHDRRRLLTTPAGRRKDMNDRVYHALRQQMQEIETEMDRAAEAGEPLSAAERERHLRALKSISTSLDKVTGEAGQETEALRETDVDGLRRDLARRLARRFAVLRDTGDV